MLGALRSSTLFCALAMLAMVAACSTNRPTTGPTSKLTPELTDEQIASVRAAITHKVAEASEPRPFDQPAERHEFFAEQRVAPGQDTLPLEHLHAQLQLIRTREQALSGSTGPGDIAGWEELGPGNIGGRTRSIVIDPVNHDIMYAAGVAGGIWKSTNGGESWSATDDFMLNLAVASLVIDPQDPDVLYAGTGEGVLTGQPGVRGLGIFKSTDAGASWQQLASTVDGVPTGSFWYVNKLAISPNDSSRIYAATRYGVWRSLDAGGSWTLVLANPAYLSGPSNSFGSTHGCTDIVVRADLDPDVLFAAFGSSDTDGLFRSDDGGDSWLPYSVPANQGRMTFALAPTNNDIMYILMADNGQGGQYGQLVNVYRTDDGGATFTGQVNFDSALGPYLLGNVMTWTGCIKSNPYSQGWYDNVIAVDPVDPDRVWVGGVDIFRSDDGGNTWGLGGYWIYYTFDPPPPNQIHPDHHVIVFHPDYDGVKNQTMYVGNDGGLFRTQNARAATGQEDCPIDPSGATEPEIVWERLNNGYAVTQFYHGDSAVGADVFVGGAQDNGTSRVQAVDALNQWKLIFGGDGGYVAIDPTDPLTMYVSYQFLPNLMKSVDGGETFFPAGEGITDTDGLFIFPYAMDDANPETLWTGGRRPWRTTDGTETWQLVGPDFDGPDRISAIAVAPSDSNVVYLGFQNGYVVRTTNALDPVPDWEIFVNGLFAAWVSSVAVDPVNPDIAYITYSNYNFPHVHRTVDGGQTWQSIDGIGMSGVPDIPAHWVAVRPCDSQQLYVGTELGVFVSENGGITWQPSNEGFAHTVVESLDFRNTNQLVAFSHGRGAFMTSLTPCTSCQADLDGDGAVTVLDLIEVILAWGPCPPEGTCFADLDDNGIVGVEDLITVILSWGECG